MMVGAALFVFTVITVAVNQVHLAVPLAITVALIIATIKGSMVRRVFMHLSHEKKWIYGALLLTVVVLRRPDVRADLHDHATRIGTPIHVAGAGRRSTRGTDMSLRAFHLFFIALSVVLAAFVAAWAVGQYRLGARGGLLRDGAAVAASAGGGLVVYGAAFQRKTRQL